MKIGTKILIAAIAAVGITTGVGLFIQRNVIRDQGIQLTRNQMRGAIIEAENVRASIAKLNTDGAFDLPGLLKKAEGQELRETALYGTIPVVAAWKAIEQLAKEENYGFRVPKFKARNPKNEPTPYEAEILQSLERGKHSEFFEIREMNGKPTMVYARPIKLTADCLSCHGDPKTSPTGDGRDMLGYTMENWREGEVHGAFVLTADMDRVDKVVAAGMSRTLWWMLPLAVLVGVGFFILNRVLIVRPLGRVIGSIGNATIQTAQASQQIAASSQSQAQGASEQAASLEETSSSLEEMSSMTRKNADSAQQASKLSTEARRATDAGNTSMERMTTAIKQIEQSATETAKIIRVIDEIAFQTNLLALNAAVEAARAGEAGKGFAVVAEEVRNLAMRSAEAAKNTARMIEGSVDNTRAGVTIADEVGAALRDISGATEKVNGLIAEIAAASNEQSTGIEQVNRAVQQMDKVTQQNAANAEESAAASEELAAQAEQLRSAVDELQRMVGINKDAPQAIPDARVSGAPSASRKLRGDSDFGAFRKAA
jgi:methyl-accepting chemotaxis protein